MISPPTLPRRPWLERATLVVEFGLLACGILTLLGWWFHLRSVLQLPLLGHSTCKFNAALGLTFLAAALLALENGRRRLAALALVSAVTGALTLLEFAGLALSVDELFARDYLAPNIGQPGRMTLVTAISLVVGGVTLAWHATSRFSRARLLASAVVGSLVASAGFSTLVGYGAGLPAVYMWGTGMAMGPVTAFALLGFGLALVSYAWRRTTLTSGEPPAWSPLPVIVGCLTLTVVLWIGLGERETTYIGANTATAMARFATSAQGVLDRDSNELERVAARYAAGGAPTATIWDTDAHALWTTVADDGCQFVEYIDRHGTTTWLYPRAGNEGDAAFDHRSVPARADAMAQAARTRTAVVTATTSVNTAPGFAIYAPVVSNHELLGYVGAEFAYQAFFQSVADSEPSHGQYRIEAAVGGVPVFETGAGARSDDSLTSTLSYPIAERRVQLTFTPLASAITRDRRFLPELALLAGFGITGLFGLSVHLARRARAGQRSAELSNRRLFAENEERRRIEARLKISDERLRLALDSTQIGIFEWSVPAGHVYYSPGLWAMLGYDHERMPSTAEAWQTLIHPDDLTVYERRLEAQLSGAVSFIEPEYRVRTKGGDWRWVYSRSKSVAHGVDGRPLRIVGSVQDITARREAELALRESQAEARKLSLVAAKTDNPVMITSPDGRIEWANEAFCRMMEYSLPEVVGKRPSDFVVGENTHLDTLIEIRTAIAAGQSISTDLVQYAKSGRKYHLHVEIQPVRNAAGKVENFIAVQTDITARVETEHQLRRAKAEADEASRAKSDFLAAMSHEIRTPMNGVIGMTSLLAETTLSGEQRDYVNTIRSSGEALLTIINDVLDFSKIESGRMELERAPFELAGCVEEVLDLFALQATAKHLEMGYHITPDVPAWIVGDVTRLRQVLINLVNNAVKFTPRGSIALEVRLAAPPATPEPPPADTADLVPAEALHLEFTVRDTGIGIPPEALGRLFKAFSQVDSSTTRKYGGTGLGLAISQRLTRLMGGDIRVESTPGRGSAFIFVIAVEAAAAASEGGPVAPAALRGRSVLCVTEQPVTRARLASVFNQLGVTAVMAANATTGVRAAATLPAPPALIVVDLPDAEDRQPFEALAPLTCPRLVLYPFGQSAPTAAEDALPVIAVSKPIRTAALLHAVTVLLRPWAPGGTPAEKAGEPLIGSEIPLQVLLAEDNMVNQKVALRFLERLGYRADAVSNGTEAVAALERRRYDLVLMDLQMPELDGFDATRQIRAKLPAHSQPKIVALTANALHGDRDLCFAAGMDDYISKPVKMHEIVAVIRRHFGRQKQLAGDDLIG